LSNSYPPFPSVVFNSNFAESSTLTPEIHVTPKTHSRSLGSPGAAHANIMDAFEDSDDEDEEIFLSPGSNDMIVDSGQEIPMLLDVASVSTNTDEKEEHGDTGDSSPTDLATLLDVDSSLRTDSPVPPFSLPKTRITVRDVAYTTYRAMLYYVSFSGMTVHFSEIADIQLVVHG